MASAEVIKKEVNPDPEVKENAEIIPKETAASPKLKEPETAPTGDAQQLQAPPQQQPPQPQNQQPAARTRSSREEKMRKKDDKSVDHVLKALNSLNTTEEKLAAMCKKYADLFDENRKLQLALKQAEKRCSTLQREKEQLQTDHSKAILTRSRLENLCRELQRQNKAIKDESLLKIREEEEKRKEVSAKFQATLNEITTLMQQNNDKNMKLRDDNIDMNAKLKNVCEQYEVREQQVEKISKQMQLEAQLADAKLAKAKMEMAAEREIMLREKQQLLMELSQYQARCQEFQTTEISLRSQISMYDDKYDEFQKALARSNEVFGGFKGEMEKMSKKMCKLEKEVSTWKQRWEGSHRALLEMAEEKQKADQELNHANRQVLTLQRLCRTLQGERSTLLAKLKGTSPNDEKIDVPNSKIEDGIANDSGDQLTNLNLQNSSEQHLVNGDVTENKSVSIDNSSENKSDNPIKISEVDKNCTIPLAPSTDGCVPKESLSSSKETLPRVSDKSSNDILIQGSDQSSPLLHSTGNSLCQLIEQNNSRETDLGVLNNSNSSVVNNSSTSLENLKISDSSKLQTSPVTEVVSSVGIISTDSVSTCPPEQCPVTPSDGSVGISLAINSVQQPAANLPVTTETSIVTAASLPLIENPVANQSDTSDSPVSSAADNITENSSNNNSLCTDYKSSVEYTVADVLKSTKVLPAASHDKTNKQVEDVIVSHDNKEIIKENCSSNLKQKSNEQPVKKQNNEPKKGKESRKKKKNA